jgi:protein-S-isoprenylcysteine O-methyltransferase Ste14
MRIYPLALALLLALAMVALHVLSPVLTLFRPPVSYLGIALMAIGSMLVLGAAGIFRRRHTTLNPVGEPSQLATEGLYRLSRNPMYLGMANALFGLAIYLGNILPFLAPPLFVWFVTKRFILHEEAVLEERFGAEYLAYKSRVRRWL